MNASITKMHSAYAKMGTEAAFDDKSEQIQTALQHATLAMIDDCRSFAIASASNLASGISKYGDAILADKQKWQDVNNDLINEYGLVSHQ